MLSERRKVECLDIREKFGTRILLNELKCSQSFFNIYIVSSHLKSNMNRP